MAEIQFSKGLKEPVVPDIRLSRTKTGEKGSAKFYFEQPTILGDQQKSGIVLCVLWNVTVAKTV